MRFLTFVAGVFGRGGVGFLLASALAGAKAEVEKLKKSIGFYSVICLCALCARMAQTKGRERTTTKIRTQQRKKKRTLRKPPKSHNKHHFGGPKWLPKSVPGLFVSLLAPSFAQDRPQDASKSALGSLRGARQNFRRAQSRRKTISQPFLAVLKTEPHPGGGKVRKLRPLFF